MKTGHDSFLTTAIAPAISLGNFFSSHLEALICIESSLILNVMKLILSVNHT